MIAVVDELGISADIQHIQNMYDLAQHGVLRSPVLTIRGEIKTKGRLLQKAELKKLIRESA